MLNNILISLLAIIIIVQFYLNFSQNNIIIPSIKNEDTEDTEVDDKDIELSDKNKIETVPKKKTNAIKQVKNSEETMKNKKQIETYANGSNFSDFPYGQPHNVTMEVDGPLYEWFFDKPNPWSTIKNKPNTDYSYLFCLKTEVPSIDKFIEWKSIIPNLNFNPNTRELIIPTNDEEGALSVANLILNNFKNRITTQDIISNNLINISINKAKNFPVVKIKLREQIMELLNSGKLSKGIKKAEYEKDLYNAVKHHDFIQTNAYNGNEFSFL
jgi:hypothetical protein